MVNVDTVYQKVLAIANKEQRGYITPQEFNLFANQAQMDIFGQYFYDLNQFKRLPGNDSKYADVITIIEDKLSIFKGGPVVITNGQTIDNVIPGQNTYNWLHKLTDVHWKNTMLEEINYEDYVKTQYSPLTKATSDRPVYFKRGGKLYHYGVPAGEMVTVNYIRKPLNVNWTYIVVNEKALYNPHATDAQNFEVHVSEEVNLVVKILSLAGIALKNPSLYQVATAEDNKNIQQEKQ